MPHTCYTLPATAVSNGDSRSVGGENQQQRPAWSAEPFVDQRGDLSVPVVSGRPTRGGAEGRVGEAQVGVLAEEELDDGAAAMQGRGTEGVLKLVSCWHARGELTTHGREVADGRVEDQVVDPRAAADQFLGGLGVAPGDRGL